MDPKTETTERRPGNETARLGRSMYERNIRHLVEEGHVGEIIAIDVDTERWALGESGLEAVAHLREIRPEAVNILCERVGYRALASFGGRLQRRTD